MPKINWITYYMYLLCCYLCNQIVKYLRGNAETWLSNPKTFLETNQAIYIIL
jgi:hypothetical protein